MGRDGNWKYYGLCVGFILVVIGHAVIILLNTLAPFFLAFRTPWYVSVPLITALFSPVIGASYCALNQLENYFRERLGLRQIEGYVTTFYVNELRRVINDLRKS